MWIGRFNFMMSLHVIGISVWHPAGITLIAYWIFWKFDAHFFLFKFFKNLFNSLNTHSINPYIIYFILPLSQFQFSVSYSIKYYYFYYYTYLHLFINGIANSACCYYNWSIACFEKDISTLECTSLQSKIQSILLLLMCVNYPLKETHLKYAQPAPMRYW